MSSMTFWESKDPNDIDDFALDWTNQLKGEQLTAAEWSFVNAAGAAIEASSVSSPFAKVRLSGGIENANRNSPMPCHNQHRTTDRSYRQT
jgi:hypothetical protein